MLRELCDRIKVKNKNIVIVLASQISEENVLIVAMADDEAMKAGSPCRENRKRSSGYSRRWRRR